MTNEKIEERKEYLRSTISATEVLTRYGIQVKRSRCRGFCHDGKDMNMKVFRTGCHCFVCSKSMDIFDITMHFNNCDFWTAFELLGGTEKPSFTAVRKGKKAQRERQIRVNKQKELNRKLKGIRMHITAYRNIIARAKPFSYIWCYCHNKLQYQLYLLEYYTERGDYPAGDK